MTARPRYQVTDGVTVCLDCGVVVAITEAHTRYHSILGGRAEQQQAARIVITCTQHGVASCPCLTAPASGSARWRPPAPLPPMRSPMGGR